MPCFLFLFNPLNMFYLQGYWAAGLHLYTPLPFKPGQGGIGDILRTHFFVNAGNIDNFDFSMASLLILFHNLTILSVFSSFFQVII
jgi:hypothetical protein